MIKIGGKIPITIHPTFWLIAGFISLVNTTSVPDFFIWMGVISLSVLVHEFGHALAALAFGQKTAVELVMLGGMTSRKGKKLPFWQEFLVVFNGPFAGFLLCAFGWYGLTLLDGADNYYAFLTFSSLMRINLVWSILNLIPVIPLDGGYLLSILLEAAFGVRGVKIGLVVSIAIAVIIGFFSLLKVGLLGSLFLIFAFENYRALRSYKLMTEDDRNEDIQQLFYEAKSIYNKGLEDEALAKFHRIREVTIKKKGIVYSMATQYIAEILHRHGKDSEAYEILKGVERSLLFDGLQLLHNLAYDLRDYKKAIRLGNKCFQVNGNHETAFLNALSNACIGDIRATLGWLQCAQRLGVENMIELLKNPGFDAIRDQVQFQKFERSLYA